MKDLRLVEQPDLYEHPAPFEINQYWQEDIEMGPDPPRLKRSRKATIDSTKRDASVEQNREKMVKAPESAHVVGQGKRNRRYRRATEEMQFEEESEEEDEDDEGRSRWDSSAWKAPALNDLHPPVVSVMPMRPSDRRWMKLPPPSTDFLSGNKGVTVIEKKPRRKTKDSEGLGREARQASRVLQAAEIQDRDFVVNGTLKAPSPADATLDSRPDSGVSTSQSRAKLRHQKYRGRASLDSASVSHSDADDEEDDTIVVARPRAVYRPDLMVSQSRPTSKRSVRKAPVGTSVSQNTVPVRVSTPNDSRARSYSENQSPKTSPQSHASIGSPLSSNESLPLAAPQVASSPMVLAERGNKDMGRLSTPAAAFKRSSSHQHNRTASRQNELDHMDLIKGLALHDSHFERFSPDFEDSGGMPWSDIEEQLAREHLWLGQRGAMATPNKRWSTDF